MVRLPDPFQAHYGIVPLPPPEDSLDISPIRSRYDAAQSALARIDTLAVDLADPWLISRLLTRREAVSSSAIEGTNSTLEELLLVEEDGDGNASSDARQVRSYAHALDRLIPEAAVEGPRLFSLETMQSLHRLVMQEDPDYADTPGALRDRVVWIGGRDIAYSSYNPAPPDRISECLQNTIGYLRLDGAHSDGMLVMRQGLLTRMAVAHAHFEAVHPFRDGNGRVGRLLLPLMMAAEGHTPLYLSPYIEAHRDAYYASLKAAQQRLDWNAIIGFLCDAVLGTVAELGATRMALIDLGRRWEGRRAFRKNAAAQRALAFLPHYPVVTISRLGALLSVSFPSAAHAMRQLEDAGIVRERTGQQRNRLFVATEALTIINRPFGSEPILDRED